MSAKIQSKGRPESERCGVCLAWPEEHNDWQRQHCEEIAERREWDKPMSPLYVRGGTLEDFKNACGAPTSEPPYVQKLRTDHLARVQELERIFAEIWGLAQTDCGPEDYHLFPQMLHESYERLRDECDSLKAHLAALKERLAHIPDHQGGDEETWIDR